MYTQRKTMGMSPARLKAAKAERYLTLNGEALGFCVWDLGLGVGI